MVWFVEPLEISRDGTGIGKYRLVASSDEGGGMHSLCEHEHETKVDASECQEARQNEGYVTGIPYLSDADRAAMLEAQATSNLEKAARLRAGNQ